MITGLIKGWLLVFLSSILLTIIQISPADARIHATGIIYVDADNVEGRQSGRTWDTAYMDLQRALNFAVPGDQIWVAEGTYLPTKLATPLIKNFDKDNSELAEFWDPLHRRFRDLRFATFRIPQGVALYGGFDPSDGIIAFADRNWKNNPTVLSGNMGEQRKDNDNCYHVVMIVDGNEDTTIDGFTITEGMASGSEFFPNSTESGAGMYLLNGTPSVTNCTFQNNTASRFGGAIHNQSAVTFNETIFLNNQAKFGGAIHNAPMSSPLINRCHFENNSAFQGGAIYDSGTKVYSEWVGASSQIISCSLLKNESDSHGGAYYGNHSSTDIVNSVFSNNNASGAGGAVYLYLSAATTINCSFGFNKAGNIGGGIYSGSSTLKVINCILWDNDPDEVFPESRANIVMWSNIKSGFQGPEDRNMDKDPMWKHSASGYFLLRNDSPCIDSGSSGAIPDDITKDIQGNTRVFDYYYDGNPTVDMGADEYCVDSDSDLVCNLLDNCADISNPYQADRDADGIGDICDMCPDDMENDSDADSICESDDICPDDPQNDIDTDGICGDIDNCPQDANPDQLDSDDNDIGDVCDDKRIEPAASFQSKDTINESIVPTPTDNPAQTLEPTDEPTSMPTPASEPTPSVEPTDEPDGDTGLSLWILIGPLLAALLLGAGGYFLFGRLR